MKRIEFIAPVEAMRGNLGETQRNIIYPTHDNRAYDGPVGERNTARNYNPIVVGAKRANGRTYFSVRTKTTNHLTTLAKKSMAAMGATCSMYAAMRKDPTVAAKMDDVFEFMRPYLPAGVNDRSYFMERISIALKDKEEVIDLSAGDISFTIANPFVFTEGDAYLININKSVLVKFWDQLANNPVTFTVNGEMGVAHAIDDFDTIVKRHYNVLLLSVVEEDDAYMVKQGEKFVVYPNGSIMMQTYGIDSIDITGNKLYLQDEPGQEGG